MRGESVVAVAFEDREGRIGTRRAEVEWFEGIGGIEMVWWDCGILCKSQKPEREKGVRSSGSTPELTLSFRQTFAQELQPTPGPELYQQ